MTEEEVKLLLQRLEKGQCTPEEEKLLMQWAIEQEQYGEIGWTEQERRQFQNIQSRAISAATGIDLDNATSATTKRSLIPWLAAASVLLILAVGGYSIFNSPAGSSTPAVSAIAPAVMPGSDRAILTLSDGRRVELNNKVSETINDGDLHIQNKNGQLVYGGNPAGEIPRPSGTHFSNESLAYNTMTTPRGGQYKLLLPDGTRAWLNAGSSITYPTVFNGETREISVSGEVYMEVKKDKSRPFVVTTSREKIEVLGTSFNVNAYAEESFVTTTLIEGSVKLNGNVLLQPGEQSLRDNKTGTAKVVKADTELAVAWKNGQFNFSGSSLQMVMRQLARWYDVSVEYSGKIPDRKFGGKISRNVTLNEVISILNFNDIHARIEGRKIIIDP